MVKDSLKRAYAGEKKGLEAEDSFNYNVQMEDSEGNQEAVFTEGALESESSDRSLDKDELEKKALKILNLKLASTHHNQVPTTSEVVKTLNRMKVETDVVSSISGTKVTRESIPNSILIILISICIVRKIQKAMKVPSLLLISIE